MKTEKNTLSMRAKMIPVEARYIAPAKTLQVKILGPSSFVNCIIKPPQNCGSGGKACLALDVPNDTP
jgi:hypothetical protein